MSAYTLWICTDRLGLVGLGRDLNEAAFDFAEQNAGCPVKLEDLIGFPLSMPDAVAFEFVARQFLFDSPTDRVEQVMARLTARDNDPAPAFVSADDVAHA